MSHIRIESHERVAKDMKIFYVPGKGADEIDISSCVHAASVDMSIGEAVTATLGVYVGSASMSAEVEDIVVTRLKPKRWWRRLREITAVNDEYRRWA